jgi:hypothetical protein
MVLAHSTMYSSSIYVVTPTPEETSSRSPDPDLPQNKIRAGPTHKHGGGEACTRCSYSRTPPRSATPCCDRRRAAAAAAAAAAGGLLLRQAAPHTMLDG